MLARLVPVLCQYFAGWVILSMVFERDGVFAIAEMVDDSAQVIPELVRVTRGMKGLELCLIQFFAFAKYLNQRGQNATVLRMIDRVSAVGAAQGFRLRCKGLGHGFSPVCSKACSRLIHRAFGPGVSRDAVLAGRCLDVAGRVLMASCKSAGRWLIPAKHSARRRAKRSTVMLPPIFQGVLASSAARARQWVDASPKQDMLLYIESLREGPTWCHALQGHSAARASAQGPHIDMVSRVLHSFEGAGLEYAVDPGAWVLSERARGRSEPNEALFG